MTKKISSTERLFLVGVILVLGLAVFRPKGPVFTSVLVLATVAGFGLAVGVWSFMVSNRKRQAKFGCREPLATEELFAAYYADSRLDKNVFVRLWNDCAAKLKIAPEKLRPTDSFKDALAVRDFWASLADPREDLVRYATQPAKNFGATIDLKGIKTLDELIRQLAAIEMCNKRVEK